MSGETTKSSRSLKRNHSESMLTAAAAAAADTASGSDNESMPSESLAEAAMAVAKEIIDAHIVPLNPKIKPYVRFDDIYRYDKKQQQDILTAKPWEKDAHFFKEVKISALALLKMVTHSRSGGNLEVMGLVVGKTDGSTMIVLDSFALPVEGTETRVNAQSQAYEFMADYMDALKQVQRHENVVGWYHSHPGYGCWLSGIDVSTQVLHQNFQEPFLAIVVDPIRTVSASKVCLGAFRTYPRGYKPANEEPSEYQTIPLHKIEDFGVHCKQYYALDVSYFKSRLDNKLLESLWNKYWVSNLSSSTLTANSDYISSQIFDLSDKLEQSESNLGRCYSISSASDCNEIKRSEDKLMKATKDSNKTTIETLHGIMSQVLKDRLFNSSSIQLAPRVSNYRRKLLQRQQREQQPQPYDL